LECRAGGPSGSRSRTTCLFPRAGRDRIVRLMETRSQPAPSALDAGVSPAEELPGLYRAILVRVAELEQLGEREEAAAIRRKATSVYSDAWNAAGRRNLFALLGRADRVISGETQPRTWVLRRRSAAAR
jgi:hypothetical protein